MKQLLIIAVMIAVAGCSTTVPVKRTFPDVDAVLKTPCPDLALIPDTEVLTEVITVVANNYAAYKECQLTVEMWNQWHQEQKKNFDAVK